MLALLALALPLGGAARLDAQSLGVTDVVGEVRDIAGRPLARAEVLLIDRVGGSQHVTESGHDGRFRFRAVLRGQYDLHVAALGFVPMVVLGVQADEAAVVDIQLRAGVAPVQAVDTVRSGYAFRRSRSWVLQRGLGDFLGTHRTAVDLSAASTVADATGIEGLPWRHVSASVDGTALRAFGAPAGTGADVAGLALPVRALADAEIGAMGFDVENAGVGSGLTASTLRGGPRGPFRAGTEGGAQLVGGTLMHAAPLGAGAAFMVGADAQRVEERSGEPNPADLLRAHDRQGVFGRFDWRGEDGTLVSGRVSVGRAASSGLPERRGAAAAMGAEFEALAAHAAVSLFRQFSPRFAYEWRVSTDGEYLDAANGADRREDLATAVTDLGRVANLEARTRRVSPRTTAILHGAAGRHQFKVGASLATHEWRVDYAQGTDGVFSLGFRDALSAQGAWRRVEAPAVAGDFRMTEWALFFQNRLVVTEGLALHGGVRVESFGLPRTDVAANDSWRARSGLDNRDFAGRSTSASPRLGFTWQLDPAARWQLDGGVAVFRDIPDVRDVAEALTFDRAVDVRYGVGAMPVSGDPTALVAPVVGQTATVLAPRFDGPRTRRAALGLRHRSGEWSGYVEGVYRHTDRLTRRQDLNRPVAPLGVDQHGRPLYGVLSQQAATLAAVAGSNRRFVEYEAVYGLEQTGVSEFAALTVGVNRDVSRRLSVAAEYTYSSTRDNVLSYAQPRLSPFPDGLEGRDWTDGRSDLDVPHRVFVLADWRIGSRLGFAVAYRGRSGAPYTPTMRAGVDANGDGDGNNDPAFVDMTLPGMPTLVAAHPCLREAAGTFVERNGCRDAWINQVDVRLSFTVAQTRIGRVDAVFDALDLLPRTIAPRDRALMLVDPSGTVSFNATTGDAAVPYVLNPAYGRAITARQSTAFLRAGVRITR